MLTSFTPCIHYLKVRVLPFEWISLQINVTVATRTTITSLPTHNIVLFVSFGWQLALTRNTSTSKPPTLVKETTLQYSIAVDSSRERSALATSIATSFHCVLRRLFPKFSASLHAKHRKNIHLPFPGEPFSIHFEHGKVCYAPSRWSQRGTGPCSSLLPTTQVSSWASKNQRSGLFPLESRPTRPSNFRWPHEQVVGVLPSKNYIRWRGERRLARTGHRRLWSRRGRDQSFTSVSIFNFSIPFLIQTWSVWNWFHPWKASFRPSRNSTATAIASSFA